MVELSFILVYSLHITGMNFAWRFECSFFVFCVLDVFADFQPHFFLLYIPEVESSRTSLALRTHFEVLGLGLEASSPWPWPRSLRSRGQHYFLNRWNFVGKRQKPRGKFANTFFVFRSWSIGLAMRASSQLKFHQWQKCDKKAFCFFSFSFFLVFFAYTTSEQQYWRSGAPGPPKINFCQPI